jgi:hypothetical protein
MTLNQDQVMEVRRAVAVLCRRDGLAELAEQTDRGELDTGPMMRAALAGAEAVLTGMFE